MPADRQEMSTVEGIVVEEAGVGLCSGVEGREVIESYGGRAQDGRFANSRYVLSTQSISYFAFASAPKSFPR